MNLGWINRHNIIVTTKIHTKEMYICVGSHDENGIEEIVSRYASSCSVLVHRFVCEEVLSVPFVFYWVVTWNTYQNLERNIHALLDAGRSLLRSSGTAGFEGATKFDLNDLIWIHFYQFSNFVYCKVNAQYSDVHSAIMSRVLLEQESVANVSPYDSIMYFARLCLRNACFVFILLRCGLLIRECAPLLGQS